MHYPFFLSRLGWLMRGLYKPKVRYPVNTRIKMEEIKALYDEARSATTGIKKLVQLLNLGKFVVSCTIS
ncbi:hypothetical protein Bca101_038381 [Brassica carinata]